MSERIEIDWSKQFITEDEIRLIAKRLNAREDVDLQPLYDADEVSLTVGQVKKAKDWLMDQWKTKSGKDRKNNPFGYREQEILDTFETIKLKDFYAEGTIGSPKHYYPYYIVIGKDTTFEYYYNGKINILG